MRKTLIYQLYPAAWGNDTLNSFQEMTKFLHRLWTLDVDYVWLAPFYPSPWVDGGYDITDYKDVNPRFGTLADFDEFVKCARGYGIKVIIDLVLNHTSTEHEWFKRSEMGEEKYRDYYHWEKKDLGWVNMFDGGKAFEFDYRRGMYYLHTFHHTQADLNWESPDVMREMKSVIDFWTLEHGVAGFRLDVCQFLAKDMEPSRGLLSILKYWQKPKTLEILHELFDGRGLFTIGEALTLNTQMFEELVQPVGPLTCAFNVQVLDSYDRMLLFFKVPKSFDRVQKTLRKYENVPGFVLHLESHDTPRYTSRTEKSGQELLRMMFSSNADAICLYQGQELGLKNPTLSDNILDYEDAQTTMQYWRAVGKGKDPAKVMKKLKPRSRENARRPIDLDLYQSQEQDRESCLSTCMRLIHNWKYFSPGSNRLWQYGNR